MLKQIQPFFPVPHYNTTRYVFEIPNAVKGNKLSLQSDLGVSKSEYRNLFHSYKSVEVPHNELAGVELAIPKYSVVNTFRIGLNN
jgi:hypothetical protein